MNHDMPSLFDEFFLHWFRERTEATWQGYRTRPFEEWVASRVGGCDWQQGTRWLNGLREQEIAAIEQHYHVRFPPDYRLFLQVLHSVDRPLVGARHIDGQNMAPRTAPSLYHWQRDTEAIEAAYTWLVDGLIFDVQQNALWPQSWGAKPAKTEAQETRVRELVEAAPKLIPVIGHRYLLAEPCVAGNPVLSIYQSDIILYGTDLRDFFLAEFGNLIGIGRSSSSHLTPAQYEAYQQIPFWGEFLS